MVRGEGRERERGIVEGPGKERGEQRKEKGGRAVQTEREEGRNSGREG